MGLLLLEVAAVFYVLAALFGIAQLIWPRQAGERFVLIGLFASILIHLVALTQRAVEVGAFPVVNIRDGLSLLGLLSALIAVGIIWRFSIAQMASFTAILTALLVGMSVLVEPTTDLPSRLRSPWLFSHIVLMFISEAALAVAGVVSVVYLIQDSRLRGKRKKKLRVRSEVSKRPALEVLDRVVVRLIGVGFPLMTIGILCGALFANEVLGRYWSWEPRNIVLLVVWVLYALILQFRLAIGWRGRKAAVLTVVGVLLTLAAYIGLGLAGIGTHGKDYLT